MKTKICSILALLVLAAPAFAQEATKPVCIDAHNIRRSQPARDEKSITFVMNNGERWRNDLSRRCTGISFNGFIWTLHTDRVCDNQETLRVPQTGGICTLGKFTQLPKSVPKQ
jgi:hypothetical protein